MASKQTKWDSTHPGWLQIDGIRTILLNVRDGVYNLRQILRAGLGEAEADLMFDIGQEIGRAIARNILAENDVQPDKEIFCAAVETFTRAGVGDLNVKELAWEKGWAVVTCPNTFEGWAYAQNNDVRPESKCDYSRGVLASLMIETHRAAGTEPDSLHLKDIYCIETTCVGRGDSECRFVVGISTDLQVAGLTIPQPRPTVQDQLEEMLATAQRRAVQLEVGREVALRLMAALDPDELMAQVVQLLKDYFGYYHVQVYLLHLETGFLSMVEGTGEPGRLMKESGYRLALGQGLVGKVAQTGLPMVVTDVSEEPQWLSNPFLPETLSELTIPLRLGEEILGVLDVQSKQVNGVAEEDVSLLEGLAGQIAIALQNAELFAKVETQRAKLEEQVAARTRELREFRTFAETAPDIILLSDLDETIRYANPAFYALFGYSAASNEAVGLSIVRLFQTDEWTRIGREVESALEVAGSHRGNITMLRKNGSSFLASVITFLVRDDQDVPTARAYIVRDLTAEQQIQQEQVRLREDLITTQERLIEELSTPIIPVTDDVLVMPLVGSIDNPRAQRIIEALLKEIEDHLAQIVILDITGVPQVDSDVANYLMQAALAARLLGTEAVLVGITPQVAQAFVDLDVDLTGIVTRSNLQSGVEYALSQVGLHIARKPSRTELLRNALETRVEAKAQQPQPAGGLLG